MEEGCRNCKRYKGDCGHHFVDSEGHTNFYIPEESACDGFGRCVYYEDRRSGVERALQELSKSTISDTSKIILFSCVQEVLKKEGKCVVFGEVVDQKTGKRVD